MGKILSLIIPTYNSEPYIYQLLDCLGTQMTEEVEVLIIDDGSDIPFKTSHKWAKVIRQDNKGVSSARNVGIDMSTGEYLAFIDADDLVSDKYIETILKVAKTEKFDYCYMSWRTIPDQNEWIVRLKSINDKFPEYNRCVWNRVYKRTFIGDVRFNTNKSFGEDGEFLKKLKEDGKKKSFIGDFMYYYRNVTPNSLTKRFHEGQLHTRRVIYYFPIVQKNMSYLIDEFKELDKSAEIILMTNKNELPQLEEFAYIIQPRRISGTELRGYPTKLFSKIIMPIKAQVVIWTKKTLEIGGIETFNYNFCRQMSKYYDILVLYDTISEIQKNRLSKYVRVMKLDYSVQIQCDTLMINRITDEAPRNVNFKKKVQMVHSCKWANDLKIPQNNDYLVAVSEAVAKSYTDFKPDHKVIGNLTCPSAVDKALILVSATRTGTNEKGQRRMVALSNMLKEKNIPFVWLCFCDYPIQNAHNILFMKPTLDVASYIAKADYLVQLSDHEGFCYSIVEAMELGVPVLVTPLEVLPEIGFEDNKTGYIVPFNVGEFDVEKIYKKQLKGTFEYKYDNEKRINQWKQILGKGSASTALAENSIMVKVKAKLTFHDIELQRLIEKETEYMVRSTRAYELMQKGFVELLVE